MEWVWFILTGTILFLLFATYRVGFIKGYKAGARRVVSEWKKTLEEDEDDVNI